MATIDRELESAEARLGPPPQSPGVFGWYFNPAVRNEYMRKRALYDAGAAQLQAEQLSPLRNMTLGQVSELSGFQPERLASPSQYRTDTVTEPSAVPSYRFVHTMTGEPQATLPAQPQLDTDRLARIREAVSDIDAVPRRDTLMDQRGSFIDEETALVNQATQPYQGPESMSPASLSMRPKYTQPLGEFKAGPGPEMQYDVRRLDVDQPADRYQRALAGASIERETRRPRSLGGAGAGTIGFKYNTILEAYGKDTADHWLATGMLPGGLKEQDISSRMESRQDLLDFKDRTLAETSRRNRVLEQYRDRYLRFQDIWHQKSQESLDKKDALGWARLNEARWWHDQLTGWMAAIDKSDLLSDEQQDAVLKALDLVSRMAERDLTPDEMTVFEQFKSFLGLKPAPRFQYTPRGPVGPEPGVAPPMSRSQSQAGKPQTPRITSQEQYDALPPGTEYIDSEGNTGTKAR